MIYVVALILFKPASIKIKPEPVCTRRTFDLQKESIVIWPVMAQCYTLHKDST